MLISSFADAYIPLHFNDGRPIDQMILVCDVDGVIRKTTQDNADPRIVSAIKELIEVHSVDVVFISGTPVSQNPLLEHWRRSNSTLDLTVGKFFAPELKGGRIAIYGALGGQRITPDCETEFIVTYSSQQVFEISKLLLSAFLGEIENDGSKKQKKFASQLKSELAAFQLRDSGQPSSSTPHEFEEFVFKIQSDIDPHFKLVSYGTFVESHTTNPPWNTAWSYEWLKEQLGRSHLELSRIDEEQRHLATGLAYREDAGFNFLLISKTNKSHTLRKHIQEKLLQYPNALIVTIGDTQVDFPMHEHAHLAFHVGQEQVWKNHNLSHCMLVRDQFGSDSQHVEGTLHILNLLKNNLGKPIREWQLK